MELKENQLIFVDENGDEVLCDILFTYDSEDFGKKYVFFSPVGAEDEAREVGVASYKETEEGMGELEVVTTDEEWEMLEEVFETFAEEHECGCGCGCEGDCDCDCDDDCDCEDEECSHEGCCCHHHK